MADLPPSSATADEDFNEIEKLEEELGEESDEDYEPDSDDDESDEENSEEDSLGDDGSDNEYEDQESGDGESEEDEDEGNAEGNDECTDDEDEGGDELDETGSLQSESFCASIVSVRKIATPGGRFKFPLPPPRIINNIRFPIRLVRLATELRVMILREYLVSPTDISLFKTDHTRNLSKLPPLMHRESTFIYLSENSFNLGLVKAGIREHTRSIVDQTVHVDLPIFPVRWINQISLMFSILINHPAPAPGVFIIDPHFCRLELHRLPRGRGLQVSLTTVPRYDGGPPEESCVCKLQKFANALHEVDWQPTEIVPQILDVMYWAVPKPTDSKCEKCGKRLLCMVMANRLKALQRWLVAHEKFYKCMKEMKKKIARGD